MQAVEYDYDESAAGLLRRRIEARRQMRGRPPVTLLDYAEATIPGYKSPKHILEIIAALEAVERGEIRRLMVVIPVRHGKSELISRTFPGWYLARHPTRQIIHASYASSLVTTFGRRVRNIVAGPGHARLFPEGMRLSADSKSANRWNTREGGIYVAAGVGGGITGFGMHLGIIDDPHSGGQDATSETYRDRAWEWYRSDFITREIMEEDSGVQSAVVVVGSRWHEDDLLGRILETEGEKWTVIHRPALDDFGRALWPERYNEKFLNDKRVEVGPRNWQSLYQGRPTAEEGGYFKRKDMRKGPMPPKSELRLYGASDYAVTEGGGDWTVHLVVGIDSAFRPWLVDFWRDRTSSDRWIPPLISLMREWDPDLWLEEKGVIEKSVGPMIDKEQFESGVYTMREGLTSANDKPTRARAFQWMTQRFGLWFDDYSPWYSVVVDELLGFPYGKYDDIVDCFSLIGRALGDLQAAKPRRLADRQRPRGSMTLDEAIAREDRINRRGDGRFP